MTRLDDAPGLLEDGDVDDRCDDAVAPDPDVDRVVDPLVLQLERAPIVDVGADVLGVGEHLMGGRPRPRATVFSKNPGADELLGDFTFRLFVRDESRVDVLDDFDFRLGAGNQNYPIRL